MYATNKKLICWNIHCSPYQSYVYPYWPTMTVKTLGSPIYFYYVVVVSHVSMHAQNCIPETSVSFLIYPCYGWDKCCGWDINILQSDIHIARYWLMILILVFTNVQQKIIYIKKIYEILYEIFTIGKLVSVADGTFCVYYSTNIYIFYKKLETPELSRKCTISWYLVSIIDVS